MTVTIHRKHNIVFLSENNHIYSNPGDLIKTVLHHGTGGGNGNFPRSRSEMPSVRSLITGYAPLGRRWIFVNPTLRWMVLFAVGLVIGFAGILLFLG
jgi:hypothetical protein